MNIAQYLLARLKEQGIDHVFGIPGDFILPFFQEMVDSGVDHIAACNELNAGYAADGYARLKGVGAAAVTYGPGSFSIVNAVAAYDKYRSALIVIDFGTATTFDVISARGEYVGGAISPGIKIAAEALFQHASKLPRIDLLSVPDTVIGRDTAGSMKSGIIYGYAGLVDGIVTRMKAEMGGEVTVIATGGLAELISHVSQTIETVESSLTLVGLRIIAGAL